MNQDLEEKLREYLKENYLPRRSNVILSDDENLFAAGIIDSGGVIAFISHIEKEFDIFVPDEELLPANFSSIKTIAAYIRLKQQSGSVKTPLGV